MPPSSTKRAHIHENYFAYSPPPPDQDWDITVQALDAAIDTIWDWVTNRESQITIALPEPFRGRTNRAQKYLLLCLMAEVETDGLITIGPPLPSEVP